MYLKLLLALLALLFAYFQLNDPDPWAWVALYVAVAILLAVAAFRSIPRVVSIGGLVVVGVWAIMLLPDFINWVRMGMPTIAASMKAEAPHIELTREFLGLILCGLAFWWTRER